MVGKTYAKPVWKRRLAEAHKKTADRLKKLGRHDADKVRLVLWAKPWDSARCRAFLEIALLELDHFLPVEDQFFVDRLQFYLRVYFDSPTVSVSTHRRLLQMLDFVCSSLRTFVLSRGDLKYIRQIETAPALIETARTIDLGDHFSNPFLLSAFGINDDSFDAEASFNILLIMLSKAIQRISFEQLQFCKGCGLPFQPPRTNQVFHSLECKQAFHNAGRDKEKRNDQEKQNRVYREKLKEKRPRKS